MNLTSTYHLNGHRRLILPSCSLLFYLSLFLLASFWFIALHLQLFCIRYLNDRSIDQTTWPTRTIKKFIVNRTPSPIAKRNEFTLIQNKLLSVNVLYVCVLAVAEVYGGVSSRCLSYLSEFNDNVSRREKKLIFVYFMITFTTFKFICVFFK